MTDPMPDPLLGLGEEIADAVHAVLQDDVGERATLEGVSVLREYKAIEALVAPGTVVVDASSSEGAAGRSLLTLHCGAARSLLAAVAGRPAFEADPGHADPGAEPEQAPREPDPAAPANTDPLAPAELERVARVTDRLNAAAADAVSLLLGGRINYEPARASLVEDPRFVVRPGAVQAICTMLTVDGHPLQLIQFVPNALIVRAARALDEREQSALAPLGEAGSGPSAQALGGIGLRVWAELGRARLTLSDALELSLGAVIELDREVDDPVDLLVNGVRFGSGRLTVTEDGEWAMVLDEVTPARVSDAIAD